MVEVRYRGGFGDNLFQYCFGRLLAERWGWRLRALPLPHFPRTAEEVAGEEYLSPFVSWTGSAVEERQTGLLLRDREMAAPVNARLVLYGWFQRWEYYRGHEATLRRWLATAPPPEPAHEDDLAVCLRTKRPDCWQDPGMHAGQAPPWTARAIPDPAEIRRLAERLPHRRLVLLTDNPQGEAAMALRNLEPVVMPIDSFGSWNWLRTCRRMVLTVCHPAEWWAALLSGAEHIYTVDPWEANIQSHCSGPYGCGWLDSRPLARPQLRVTGDRWIYDWQ